MMIAAGMKALATAALLLTGAGLGHAQDYPNKPVRIVVGFPPGSAGDLAARTVGARLSQTLGQPFVVENRPGASSSIAAEYSARADKDGYTLYQSTVANVVNKVLKPDLGFDLLRDFQSITLTGSVPVLLVANAALGVRSVPELIAMAKAKPGTLNYASTGVSTTQHLAGELLNMRAGVSLLHVPYQGSPQAVTDLVAGRTHVMFAPASTVLPQIKAGSLVALATASAKRTALAPELQTMGEAGVPDLDASIWFGLMAPKDIPDAIVATLSRAAMDAVANPDTVEQLRKQGFDARGGTPADFAAFIETEMRKWSTAAKAAGVAGQR